MNGPVNERMNDPVYGFLNNPLNDPVFGFMNEPANELVDALESGLVDSIENGLMDSLVNEPARERVKSGLWAIEQMIRTARRHGSLRQIAVLLKSVGPTLCGIKTGELLTYPLKLQNLNLQSSCPASYQQWLTFKPLLAYSKDSHCLELTKQNGTKYVLVVHRQALRERLEQREIRHFLMGLGYTCLSPIQVPSGPEKPALHDEPILHEELSALEKTSVKPSLLDACLKILAQRLQSDDFPHEIGLFLGYPLDDVKGFMGYGMKPLAYIKGWQVYAPQEAEPLAQALAWVRQIVERSVHKALEKEPAM